MGRQHVFQAYSGGNSSRIDLSEGKAHISPSLKHTTCKLPPFEVFIRSWGKCMAPVSSANASVSLASHLCFHSLYLECWQSSGSGQCLGFCLTRPLFHLLSFTSTDRLRGLFVISAIADEARFGTC